MTSLRGQASWAKMTSPGGKLIALGCHLTKKVNKAEKLTIDIKRKVDCSCFVMYPLLILPLPRAFLWGPLTVVSHLIFSFLK
jgi:hypothetical protein